MRTIFLLSEANTHQGGDFILLMEDVFKELNIEPEEYHPVGNHELGRHLVYEYRVFQETYIMKQYYILRRMQNERNGYHVALAEGVPSARVLQSGVLKNGSEYIILSKCKGEVMNKLSFTEEEKYPLYEEMGEYLARIHSFGIGKMKNDKEKQIKKAEKNYLECMNYPIDRREREIISETYEQLVGRQDDWNEEYITVGYCHNDYDERNVMVEERHISGIIDFENSGMGNIEKDFASLYWKEFWQKPSLEEAFFKGYQKINKISEDMKKRMPYFVILDVLSNCSWSYNKAKDFFDSNIKFLEGLR